MYPYQNPLPFPGIVPFYYQIIILYLNSFFLSVILCMYHCQNPPPFPGIGPFDYHIIILYLIFFPFRSIMKYLRMILVVVFVSLLTLYVQQTEALPLEDQLPEDTGLFFGKRSSHNPNFNNLLFGR